MFRPLLPTTSVLKTNPRHLWSRAIIFAQSPNIKLIGNPEREDGPSTPGYRFLYLMAAIMGNSTPVVSTPEPQKQTKTCGKVGWLHIPSNAPQSFHEQKISAQVLYAMQAQISPRQDVSHFGSFSMKMTDACPEDPFTEGF